MNNMKLAVALSAMFSVLGPVAYADSDTVESDDYLPYLEGGGTRFFNVDSSYYATGADLFIPLWQSSSSHLVFTDLRLYDRTGKPWEGNAHLGYRYLTSDNSKLFGVYGAFDRKRSSFDNYFSQITLGAEAWFNNLFIGANYYLPVGKTLRGTGLVERADSKYIDNGRYNVLVSADHLGERAARGADMTLGYEFVEGVTLYAGGYYFKASDMQATYGPKAKLAYDFSLSNGEAIFGVFDKLGFEVGAQHDKPRGTVGYVNVNFRIGILPYRSNLTGVARHMIDLVRRDVDIVTQEDVVDQTTGYGRDENGDILEFEIQTKPPGGGALKAENSDGAGKKRVVVAPGESVEFKSPHSGKAFRIVAKGVDLPKDAEVKLDVKDTSEPPVHVDKNDKADEPKNEPEAPVAPEMDDAKVEPNSDSDADVKDLISKLDFYGARDLVNKKEGSNDCKGLSESDADLCNSLNIIIRSVNLLDNRAKYTAEKILKVEARIMEQAHKVGLDVPVNELIESARTKK